MTDLLKNHATHEWDYSPAGATVVCLTCGVKREVGQFIKFPCHSSLYKAIHNAKKSCSKF